jgi:hypothetical protein
MREIIWNWVFINISLDQNDSTGFSWKFNLLRIKTMSRFRKRSCLQIFGQLFWFTKNLYILSWVATYHTLPQLLQMGPKVASLVARSSRGRCTQHLRRIRGCDAHPAWIWRMQMLSAPAAVYRIRTCIPFRRWLQTSVVVVMDMCTYYGRPPARGRHHGRRSIDRAIVSWPLGILCS